MADDGEHLSEDPAGDVHGAVLPVIGGKLVFHVFGALAGIPVDFDAPSEHSISANKVRPRHMFFLPTW